jgi:integrase
MPAKKKERVKVGSVSVPLYPWTDPKTSKSYWRWSWKDSTGKWCYGTRANKADAQEAARTQARNIHNGLLDLAAITGHDADLVRQFLALKPTADDIAVLRERRGRKSTTLQSVVETWVAHKLAELNGVESRTLNGDRLWFEKLAVHFPDVLPGDITTEQLKEYIEAASANPKSRKTYRARVSMLWKFAASHEIFTSTAADRLPAYKVATRDQISILTPDQARTLLVNVADEYRPWLVLALFSGLRAEEIHSRQESKKPSLHWDAVQDSTIVVPARVSKTGKRRFPPVLPTLAAWLDHIGRPETGRICERSPSRTETGRLGELIGGWPRNVLRHSYGSYRAAVLNDIPALALEMGNSVSIIEAHYREAVTPDVAAEFWKLTPLEVFRKSKKDR